MKKSQGDESRTRDRFASSVAKPASSAGGLAAGALPGIPEARFSTVNLPAFAKR
jgi:hypothetical protein